MKNNSRFKQTLLASTLALAALGLSGCQAEGDLSEAGRITGGSSGGVSSGGNSGGTSGGTTGGLSNNGTVPSRVLENGNTLAGNFVCSAGAKAYGPNPSTEVVVNGQVGGPTTDLLNQLGGATATQLLNSIKDKELVIDGNLDTAATYTLTVGLLGGAVSSIDLLIGLNSTVPVGKYAVFGLSFPIGALELSLLQSVTVTTFLDTTKQESVNIDASALDLLGQMSTGEPLRYVGMRVTKSYNKVSVNLNPTVISANVGEAMKVHELCTDGHFVAAP